MKKMNLEKLERRMMKVLQNSERPLIEKEKDLLNHLENKYFGY